MGHRPPGSIRVLATVLTSILPSFAAPGARADDPPETERGADGTPASFGATVTPEELRGVPLEGRTVLAPIELLPGVRGVVGPLDFAMGDGFAGQNRYRLDGLDITSPATGRLGTAVSLEFLREVSIVTSGAGAELGGALGGHVRLATKSGDNALHGGAWFHATPFQASPDSADVFTLSSNSRTAWGLDAGGELAGALIKDRLFFYVGFAPQLVSTRIERSVFARQALALPPDQMSGSYPGDQAIPNFPFDTRPVPEATRRDDRLGVRWGALARLDARLAPEHTLTLTYAAAPTTIERDAYGAVVGSDSQRFADRRTQAHDVLLRLSSALLGRRLLLDVLAGAHVESETIAPSSEAGRAPVVIGPEESPLSRFESIAACAPQTIHGVAFDPCPVRNYRDGGLGLVEDRASHRIAVAVGLTWLPRLLGTHTIRLGAEFEATELRRTLAYTGGSLFRMTDEATVFRTQLVRLDGDRVVPLDRFESTTAGTAESVYLQDIWNPSFLPGLTVHAGVRWEGQQLRGPDGVTRVDILDSIAPRVGLGWDFLRRGRSRLYASYGRLYERMPLLVADVLFSGVAGVTTAATCMTNDAGRIDPGTCQSPAPSPGDVAGGRIARVAPQLRGAFTEEFVTGIEHDVGFDAVIGAAFVHREAGRPMTITGDGTTVFLENTARQADRGSTATNWNALSLTTHKRLSHYFLLLASYTYGWMQGVGNGGGPLISNVERQQAYRPHDVKLAALADIPLPHGGALIAGVRFTALSGGPIGILGISPEGSPVNIVAYSYVGHFPMLTSLDVHLGYRQPLPRGPQLELYADVFNVLDQRQVTAVDEYYTYDRVVPFVNGTFDDLSKLRTVNGGVPRLNPTYGHALATQAPISLRLGLRATF